MCSVTTPHSLNYRDRIGYFSSKRIYAPCLLTRTACHRVSRFRICTPLPRTLASRERCARRRRAWRGDPPEHANIVLSVYAADVACERNWSRQRSGETRGRARAARPLLGSTW